MVSRIIFLFVIVVNLFAEIPFGWWGMITGLQMMNRARKSSRRWKPELSKAFHKHQVDRLHIE